MDIPVLGRLFRSEADRVERTELMITIRPSVIRSKEEARQVTDDYSERIEGLRNVRRAVEAQRNRRRHSAMDDGPRSEEMAPATR